MYVHIKTLTKPLPTKNEPFNPKSKMASRLCPYFPPINRRSRSSAFHPSIIALATHNKTKWNNTIKRKKKWKSSSSTSDDQSSTSLMRVCMHFDSWWRPHRLIYDQSSAPDKSPVFCNGKYIKHYIGERRSRRAFSKLPWCIWGERTANWRRAHRWNALRLVQIRSARSLTIR